MSIGYMLRMSGADFGLAKIIAVGDYVRHHGTKMYAIVSKVMPQHDGTAELVVVPFPVRDGAMEHDRRPRQWATYHVDRHFSPAQLAEEARAHRCDHPQVFTDGKPCAEVARLHAIHARCLEVIAEQK